MNADIKLDVVIFSQRNELKLGCLAKFVFKQPPQARYFMHSSITFETVSTVSLLLLIISNSYPIILIYQRLLAQCFNYLYSQTCIAINLSQATFSLQPITCSSMNCRLLMSVSTISHYLQLFQPFIPYLSIIFQLFQSFFQCYFQLSVSTGQHILTVQSPPLATFDYFHQLGLVLAYFNYLPSKCFNHFLITFGL